MDKVDMSSSTDEIGESPLLGTSDEMKDLLSEGSFKSYENLVYLAGACNVGKSTLASILIGEEIPKEWISTDGLNIYFGRNGINIKTREMVPLKLKQGSDGDVLSKVLCGEPGMTQAKPDTTQDCDKGTITSETHPQRKDITLSTSAAPNPTLVPGTGNDDVNKTDPLRGQSVQHSIIANIQEQIRKGTYKIEIAPSDLVDFGGQRSFDMTHQLFMRHKGTFVLMFNGITDIRVDLGEETTESILIHWVNSILAYCVDDDDVDDTDKDILPIILFCATHSDAFNQEDRKDKKEKLIHDLGEIFKDHKQKDRIRYNDIFFINGRNENDPEIIELKSKLVDVAFKQKSWGKLMPMATVPLELQISDLRLHNMNIISKEELMTLNQRNEDLKLKDEQIEHFLNHQHSLGKILYFDQKGLDHFIIVQPQSLVNILRSFITAECFWPKDEELKGILETLRETGEITKNNLLKLWSQEKFHQHMPNGDFKEFIIQILVHLDILGEPRHYKPESYLVPCMVIHGPPTTDVISAERTICLSYRLLKSSIPSALVFRLIGAAMHVWPLQKRKERICLYHQAAIFRIDRTNELHLSVKDDKIVVYLINEKDKVSMLPKLASAVQEHLTLTMRKALMFYHKSSISEESNLFKLEVGDWCPPDKVFVCYISDSEVQEQTEWKCKNDKIHDKTYLRYWIINKEEHECDSTCLGLDEKDLVSEPKEKHLFRLAYCIDINACINFFNKLGLTFTTWSNIEKQYEHEITVSKFFALFEWKNTKYRKILKPSFQELVDALSTGGYSVHLMCKVFKEDLPFNEKENENIKLQETPDDKVLNDLSAKLGDCALHLGVELGLSVTAIKRILKQCENDCRKETLGVMKEWKNSGEDQTILMLMKALQSADGTGFKTLIEKYSIKLKDQ